MRFSPPTFGLIALLATGALSAPGIEVDDQNFGTYDRVRRQEQPVPVQPGQAEAGRPYFRPAPVIQEVAECPNTPPPVLVLGNSTVCHPPPPPTAEGTAPPPPPIRVIQRVDACPPVPATPPPPPAPNANGSPPQAPPLLVLPNNTICDDGGPMFRAKGGKKGGKKGGPGRRAVPVTHLIARSLRGLAEKVDGGADREGA